ncbi:MAG: Glu/Leu/Phe/Val dehydrogenase [Planctomycetes bacterium]|nr:Glu/Leu/Phe/Val dehydrogenase [Planctomycetota bacterium]
MTDIARMSPRELCAFLKDKKIQRFFLVWNEETRRVEASQREVEPLARLLEQDRRDFDRHEGVFVQVAPETGTLQGAFVHRTCRGQAAGGVRFWTYDTVLDYLRDGLRLAKGMTQKNALAGLWWGGGKGVMARGTGADSCVPALRRRVYEEYGEFMSSLRGCYVTAEDVGTSVEDMAAIFSRTRFTTCIPEHLGGSGNPSVPTARGVVRGMEAALHHLGMGTLLGKTVALQGIGHVGAPLAVFLRDKGVARIIGSDVDPARADELRHLLPGADLDIRIVERGDCSLFAEPADILSPNATGAVLGPATIPSIAARVVCGAANNQLENPERDDRLLEERGILYLPDFLVNRMGIVNCADEQSGCLEHDPGFERHLGDEWENSVFNLSLEVLAEAQKSGRTPHRVAVEIADRRSFELNPIFGHRGAAIIRDLARSDWARGQ